VTLSGAPALDNIRETALLERKALQERIGIPLAPRPLIVTFHPTTLEFEDTRRQATELTAALAAVDRPIVITHPNADAANQTVLEVLKKFATDRPNVRLISTLGPQLYYSLLACSAAMVGNSSSGIIEAPSYCLPVVNVGRRQAGRERSRNVIDVDCTREAILAGIGRALSDEFVRSLDGLENPYGDGHAAPRIAEVLASVPLDIRLRTKRFHACAAN
jgi:UDP-hydrolysing UDP-N-acetyl-D-glucosamine 2-epimerase